MDEHIQSSFHRSLPKRTRILEVFTLLLLKAEYIGAFLLIQPLLELFIKLRPGLELLHVQI